MIDSLPVRNYELIESNVRRSTAVRRMILWCQAILWCQGVLDRSAIVRTNDSSSSIDLLILYDQLEHAVRVGRLQGWQATMKMEGKM